MNNECTYCEQAQVVPVLDASLQERAVPGNKYRRFCLSCRRWLAMCSESYFQEHPTPHVLPVGSELAEKNVIPLEEAPDEVAPTIRKSTDARTSSESGTGRGTQRETIGEARNTTTDTQAGGVERRVRVLNESVRALVDENLIDEAAAYQFLSSTLAELPNKTE